MMPFAPQVDRTGSPFLSDGLARWSGDAAILNQPDRVVFYPGTDTSVPVLTNGGVITLLPPQGEQNNLVLAFRDIVAVNVVKGNAVVNKHKTRIECQKKLCQSNEYYGTILTQRETGTVQYARSEYMAFDPLEDPDCVQTCQQRAQSLVNRINADPYAFVTATLVTETVNSVSTYSVDIEAKIGGVIFDQSVQGFTPPDILVAATRESYTARLVRAWYGAGYIPSSFPDSQVLTVAEIQYLEDIKLDNYSTSSNASPHGIRAKRLALYAVIFDETVTNSASALTELKAIVNYEREAALYHSRLISTAGNPAVTYPFTIAKTDAGDASAFTTASTAYSNGNTVKFTRMAYDSTTGKSYYTIISKVNTPPTPSGSDVVEPGSYGPDDTPCVDCE